MCGCVRECVCVRAAGFCARRGVMPAKAELVVRALTWTLDFGPYTHTQSHTHTHTQGPRYRRLHIRDTWGVELDPCRHVLELESLTDAEAAAAAAAAASAAAARGDGGGTSAAPLQPAPLPPPSAPVSDKWSRHLLVRLPGLALAGNSLAGAIVAKMG